MITYKNVVIVGTSHIARESLNRINSVFSSFNPDIVCVELDRQRLHALLSNTKPSYSISSIKDYGLTGYLFIVIGGYIQRKLGNVVGIKPGSDMLSAVNLARSNSKRLELIDQDISITIKEFSRRFTFKEKMRLVVDILRSPFSKRMRIDLSKVPHEDLIRQLMQQLKSRYPNLYAVLIDDRNKIMARRIFRFSFKEPQKRILVVIGAGHEQDMLALIKKEELRHDKIY
jgi:pheromone shutdown-related protein TraB